MVPEGNEDVDEDGVDVNSPPQSSSVVETPVVEDAVVLLFKKSNPELSIAFFVDTAFFLGLEIFFLMFGSFFFFFTVATGLSKPDKSKSGVSPDVIVVPENPDRSKLSVVAFTGSVVLPLNAERSNASVVELNAVVVVAVVVVDLKSETSKSSAEFVVDAFCSRLFV